MHTVYLGLGSNLGDKASNLRLAIKMIGEKIGAVEGQSEIAETEPWGFLSENIFLNAAVRVATEMTPDELLLSTQEIERELGRTVKSVDGNYHDRTIDIDILLYDHEKINTDRLTVPHPLMTHRDFVMNPLREVIAQDDYNWLKSVK